ncbi:hypothetical protein AB0G05_34065 [Nonomuraea wenchangensis]
MPIVQATGIGICDDLEQAGHVQRERNPRDRRSYAVRATISCASASRSSDGDGGSRIGRSHPAAIASARTRTHAAQELLGLVLQVVEAEVIREERHCD